ncbi:macro domain-like protein [Lentinus tigrinus ALCF2SS1-6]|uniref:Macro domain-like protein n=1 Tax=Lentinus tigrinus ALCF2SS1-6 TaxID=1328759 RepID=A0A5C2SFQ6_9APHY|nr:macro domain-like protein [Lentinus tigrinus ALCF2SS1-6]
MTIEFTLFVDQWRQSFFALIPDEVRDRVSFVHTSLQQSNTTFDCIVSPANSFGRFDGGEVLAPADDLEALTRAAQTVLYQRWRGFAPPGTCTLIPLTGTPCHPNPYDCRYIALCPTMRFPSNVTWHKEIVYNCVWSLLVAIDEHNARAAEKDSGLAPIASVGMTGLATGVGRVSPAVCARQTALAFAHNQDAKNRPEKWSSLSWDDILEMPLNGRLPMDG